MGHTGTLDPDATGVLPVAIGSACRLISYLSQGKVYLADILLGVKTATDDLSGTVIERNALDSTIDHQKIELSLQDFIGNIKQRPPIFSAVHYEGKRLHHLVRRKNLEADPPRMAELLAKLEQRAVNIEKIDLLKIELPVVTLRIFCSTGTYIRSLARDLGEILGCGACLQSLRREESGPFNLIQSYKLETLQDLIENGQLLNVLTSPEKMIDLKMIELNKESALLISQGKYLHVDAVYSSEKNTFAQNELVFAVYRQAVNMPQNIIPIALAKISENGIIKPKVGLIHPDQLGG